jgi:hypothetical protein
MRIGGKRGTSLLLVFAVLVLAPSGLSRSSAGRYPSSIAVLGHSGATGYNSDPRRPNEDVRANSWATGTNSAVRSVYFRILARNPRIKGHNVNLAEDGARVDQLIEQAHSLVRLKPKPELVLVQIMDNDIVCPAAKTDYAAFRRGVATALHVIAGGAPRSRIFVVSQFGSPGTYAKALTRLQRLAMAGSGPCDFVSPSGKIVPTKLARLDGVIHGYEAQLAAACKTVSACRYDNGAFGRIVDRHEWISSDLNHFSIRGHAEAAAVAWAALRRAGLIPR